VSELISNTGIADEMLGAPAQRHVVRHANHAKQSRISIALHWYSVIAMTLTVGFVLVRSFMESPAGRVLPLELHQQSGLFVLLFLVLRLAARVRLGWIDHAHGLSKMMKLGAAMAHVALYACLFAMPMLGWALCNSHGVTLRFMGVIPLPALVEADSDLADNLTDAHVMLAWSMLALIVMHIAAALWHHYVRRDGVLVAMLPETDKS
jgi:cytochrome b561